MEKSESILCQKNDAMLEAASDLMTCVMWRLYSVQTESMKTLISCMCFFFEDSFLLQLARESEVVNFNELFVCLL